MEKRNFIRDINEFRAICTLSATNNFSETVYRKENKGNVSTLSLILTPFSPPCCFRGNKRGGGGGKYISPEIVVRLVITANEIFIEKFAAINLAPVIIFHLFDQRSVISSMEQKGRGDWDVSIIRQFPSGSSVLRVEIKGGGGWKMARKIVLVATINNRIDWSTCLINKLKRRNELIINTAKLCGTCNVVGRKKYY